MDGIARIPAPSQPHFVRSGVRFDRLWEFVRSHSLAVFLAASLVAGLALAFGGIRVLEGTVTTPTATAASTPTSEPADVALSGDVVHGLTIAGGGFMHVRGARVTAVHGTVLSLEVPWGSAGSLTISAEGNYSTRYLNAEGEQVSVSDIRIGEYVDITGSLVGAAPLTVQAGTVRSLTHKQPTVVELNTAK